MNHIDNNDIVVASLASSSDNFRVSSGMAAGAQMIEKNEGAIVIDIGEIHRFNAPRGWHEQPQEQTYWAHQGYSRDFCPADNPNATLSIYSRGTAISERSAESFQEILHSPVHVLSTPEIESITQVLSKLADQDAFAIGNAQTMTIAGRKVLIVDGEWKTSGIQFHGILLSSGVDGREIQEVFFEAPAQEFSKHLGEAVESICSIKWKQEEQG